MAKYLLEHPIWERQKWEENTWYDAYLLYRDTPIHEKRSVSNVYKRLLETWPEGAVPTKRAIYYWSGDYRWEERVLAYDRYLDGKRMKQVLRRSTEMAERHATLATAMQQIVGERLRSLDPQSLTARDIKEWMEVSTRIERAARGESSDTVRLELHDGREQHVARAKEFYGQMSLESPQMTDQMKAQIIFDAFDVLPHELGLDPRLLEGGTDDRDSDSVGFGEDEMAGESPS